MASAVLSGDDPRERAFRKAMLYSVAGHVALLGFAAFSPTPFRSSVPLPAVVDVTLVAAPPGAPPVAKPKPAPRPAPKPSPEAVVPPAPKPEPKPEKVLLPKDPVRTPKPKPEAAPKADPAPPQQVDLRDMLARLRDEAGEDAPEALAKPMRVAVAPPGGGGPGVPISAEEAAWRRRAKVHVTRAWVLQPGLRRQVISTEVRVKLSMTGEVLDVDVSRRSGNPWYDDSVVRAVEKASPLPAPPQAAEWRFVFSPQDVL